MNKFLPFSRKQCKTGRFYFEVEVWNILSVDYYLSELYQYIKITELEMERVPINLMLVLNYIN